MKKPRGLKQGKLMDAARDHLISAEVLKRIQKERKIAHALLNGDLEQKFRFHSVAAEMPIADE